MPVTQLQSELGLLIPVLLLVIGGFTVLILDLFLHRSQKPLLPGTAAMTILIAMLLQMWQASTIGGRLIFNGSIVLDSFGAYGIMIVLAAAFMAVVGSYDYLKRLQANCGEFYSLVLFAVSGMVLVIQAHDLLTLFVAIEIMSISIYILVGLTRWRIRSNEGGLKYFIFGAFATGIILFGIAFVFGMTGHVEYTEVFYRAFKMVHDPARAEVMRILLPLGFGMILIGFLFKIGSVPFHMWVPDAYEGAPTMVTGFMAAAVKATGFFGLMRILSTILLPDPRPLGGGMANALEPLQTTNWVGILALVAGITILVGNLGALNQRNVKRMLAYSSIAHTGYALIGVLLLASSIPANASAVMFYLFVYTFMTFGAFAVIGVLSRADKDGGSLEKFKGLSKRRPLLAAAMALFMLSLAGIPPTAGFAGKYYLFMGAIQGGYIGLALVGIGGSLISLYFYLRVIVAMYFQDAHPDEEHVEDVQPALGVTIALAAGATAVIGLFPGFLIDLSRTALQAMVN